MKRASQYFIRNIQFPVSTRYVWYIAFETRPGPKFFSTSRNPILQFEIITIAQNVK